MLECFVCLAAKGVVRDAETNTISVFSILEQIGAVGFPFIFQELGVLALWRRSQEDPSSFDLVFSITNNNTRLGQETTVRIAFEQGTVHRSIITLQGVVVAEPGELRFSFSQNGAQVATYAIVVRPPEHRVVETHDVT